MNTHNINIELPPLPKFDRLSSMHADDVVRLLSSYGRKCARAAIEADRRRRGEPVASRLLRKNADGEWVTDGRPWVDGVPDADLVENAEKSEQYRIEYAFAAPQPAEHREVIDHARRRNSER